MTPRIVITAAGVVSALGETVDEFWARLCAGETGVRAVTRFDTADLPSKRAALVNDLNYKPVLPPDIARKLDRFGQMCVMAGAMCLRMAKLDDPQRAETGLIVNTTFGPVETNERFITGLEMLGAHEASPALFPNTVMNAAPGYLAKLERLHGYQSVLVGASPVEAALRALRLGRSTRIMAGAVEEVTAVTFRIGCDLGLLAHDAGRGEFSHPFSTHRTGFVLGEGAVMLLLETLDSARARGAHPIAEVIGAATVMDHTITPATGFRGVSGGALAAADRLALANAGLTPADIDAIAAAAGSSPLEDPVEAAAIHATWGAGVPVIAPKAALGEAMGLDSAVSALIAALALRDARLPPICYEDPLVEPLDLVRGEARGGALRHLLVHAWEHGGNTSSLILRRMEDV